MADRDLKDTWKAGGYSMEEMWFFRYNQELIEKLREKKGAEASAQGKPRPQLKLIQGGGEKSPEPEAKPAPVKKVA